MHPSGQSSLPPRPQWQNQQHQAYFQQNAYSSHYAQAYMPSHQPSASHSSNPHLNQSRPRQQQHQQPSGSWYQHGNKRCTYKDCQFTGAPKAVEVHMMDRHLIYPPGWDKRPKREEWDADPSLKGKPIPIQGTNVLLDSPETLEAWKEERRKRFPTSNRVEDKKRKMEEAIARGQLTVEDLGVRGDKRRRVDTPTNPGTKSTRGNSRRGRGGSTHRPSQPVVSHSLPPKPSAQVVVEKSGSSSDSDDQSEPEVYTSKPKVLPATPPPLESNPEPVAPPQPAPISRPRPQQPKRPLHNPFDNRPPLLRNLLLPEIRVTVSNLSQAIRFLVDNDFLENVELKPGHAEDTSIKVLSSIETGS